MASLVVRGTGTSLLAIVFLFMTEISAAEDGVAKKYLRDAGIDRDPDVILTEMFEGGSVTDIVGGWTNAGNAAGMSLASDVPPGSGGGRSLLMTSVGGANTGGQLYKKLVPGYDQLYFRYYVKYASPDTYHHTGGWIGGYNPPTDWPQGGAGERPTGSDRFSIGPEPGPSLRFDLYTYWMGMQGSSTAGYWGNVFVQNPDVVVRTDRWMCVEVMVKMNNPVASNNGELALWIDGTQIVHLREGSRLPSGSLFEGFQWRNSPQLNLNWIWLLYYTTGNPQGFVGRVWFDHVVLAKRYIGPMNTSSEPPSPPTNVRVQ